MSSDAVRQSLAVGFERHADEEGKVLVQYRNLAEQLGDTAAGNLVSHILTEEELHHLLLHTLARWLRAPQAAHTRAIPATADRAELLRLTQLLQRHERETIDACHRARAQLAGDDADLLGALIDALASDSEKHHRLLGAVEQLLRP